MARRTQNKPNGRQTRQERRDQRRDKRRNNGAQLGSFPANCNSGIVDEAAPKSTAPREIAFTPKTARQAEYYDSIFANTLTFGYGPAGTGKTYVSVTAACMMLKAGEIDMMIFCRPALGAEEELGFFKGDLDEKLAPWVAPIREILNKHLGSSHVDLLIKREKIRFEPFATMRGHSWERAFIMVDEAQNTTPNQIKLFLTRTGEGTTVVVDGDIRQKDLKEYSGLEDSLSKLRNRPTVGAVEFGTEDIVRSGFVRMVLEAYA